MRSYRGAAALGIASVLAATVPAAAAAAEPAPPAPTSIAAADSGKVRATGEIHPRLRWRTCANQPEMQCARYVVPLDWSDARKGAVGLALRRLPALGAPSQVIGTLFMNPGGPGVPGTQVLGFLTGFTALRKRFHVVSWDPRGVATSAPTLANCPAAETVVDQAPKVGTFSWQSVATFRDRQQGGANKVCLAANRTLSRYVGTNDVVRDLDSMRTAVGDRTLNYLGISYGTTIGRAYAMRYPGRVRAMVLDGVTDPGLNVYTYLNNQGQGAMAAWPRVMASLPAGIPEVYEDVNAHLQTSTITQGGAAVSRWVLWSIAINAARNKESLADLPGVICGLASSGGIPAPACTGVHTAANPVQDAMVKLREIQLGSPALQMVNCSDQTGRPGAKQLADWASHWSSYSGPEASSNVLNFASMCSHLPPAWNRVAPLVSLRLPTPPLLINGVADIATPYVGAQANRSRFVGSRLISVDTTFHGLFGDGTPCIDGPGLNYLVTRRLPANDISCPAP